MSEKTVARVGRVSITDKGSGSLLIRYSTRQSKGSKQRVIRKAAGTRDIEKAKKFAEDMNKELFGNPEEKDPSEIGILDAAALHPSSVRELEDSPVQYKRHMACLEKFVESSTVSKLKDLTMDAVISYVSKMKKEGKSWDTRRHALLFVKRASAYGPSVGLPDVLNGIQVDRRSVEDRGEVVAYDSKTLRKIVYRIAANGDYRNLAAALLMGFCGLRPSEVPLIKISDVNVDGCLIQVGRKNIYSNRLIPIPPTVAKCLGVLSGASHMSNARDGSMPLLPSIRNSSKVSPMLPHGFGVQFNRSVSGYFGNPVHAKSFRKSFTTILVDELSIDGRLVDSYTGHAYGGIGRVSARHYLKKRATNDLFPVAMRVEGLLKPLLRLAQISHLAHTSYEPDGFNQDL